MPLVRGLSSFRLVLWHERFKYCTVVRHLSLPDILLLTLTIGGSAISSGCRKPAAPPPPAAGSTGFKSPNDLWLQDVTEKSRLNFVHDTGPTGRYRMPEIMGSGCALLDDDNDGRLDIYLVQNAGPDGPRNQLFHQEPDGTFNDVSAGSGLDIAGWGMGVAVADVNNDGYPDVLVAGYGRMRLLLNNRDGTFRDVTEETGLSRVGSAHHDPAVGGPSPPYEAPLEWFTSAAFFDYDRDGWLDLVVTQYVAYDPQRACTDKAGHPDYCGPSLFPGAVTKLFHNMGGFRVRGSESSQLSSLNPEPRTLNPLTIPHFEDVTSTSGLSTEPGAGLGVVCLDFDGDGWPDIFVANDGRPNRLWINRHDGTFVDEAVRRGLAFNALGQVQGNMGIAVGDVAGSGRFDLFITHLTEEANALYVQSPIGMFSEQGATRELAGANFRATGFGTVLADFRNSGRPDLAVANGRVVRASDRAQAAPPDSLPAFWQPYAERNFLFANDGHGKFHDISGANPDWGGRANVGRSLAAGDIDNDGGMDLLLTTAGSEARLFRNVATDRGHWLMIRAIDPKLGGRDAIGAEVQVIAGGQERTGFVNSCGSYLCAMDPRVHFGLGKTESIDAIRIRWPDGTRESFPPPRIDQIVTVQRGTGMAN